MIFQALKTAQRDNTGSQDQIEPISNLNTKRGMFVNTLGYCAIGGGIVLSLTQNMLLQGIGSPLTVGLILVSTGIVLTQLYRH